MAYLDVEAVLHAAVPCGLAFGVVDCTSAHRQVAGGTDGHVCVLVEPELHARLALAVSREDGRMELGHHLEVLFRALGQDVLAAVPTEDRSYESKRQALNDLIAYHEGTFNLFPEPKVEEVNQQLSMGALFDMLEQERSTYNPVTTDEPEPELEAEVDEVKKSFDEIASFVFNELEDLLLHFSVTGTA